MTKQAMFDEFETLLPLVRTGLPAGHIARVRFEAADGHRDPEDDFCPPVELMTAARDAFYSIPLADQVRCLNGWQPQPNKREDFRQVVRILSPIRATRSLCLSGHPNFTAAEVAFSAHADPNPVVVFIQEGTGKAEAIALLRRMTQQLQNQWDEMLSGESGAPEMPGESNEKSQTSVTPDDPQLGGNRIEGAKARTLAVAV